MEYKHLVGILEAAGFEPFSYSGRGMYGAKCVAVTIDGELGEFLADFMIGAIAEEAGEVAAETLRSMKTDSMGRGTVVYFPYIYWPSDVAEAETFSGDEG